MNRKTPPHYRIFDGDYVKVQIQWEPRALWIDLFWRKTEIATHLYVYLLPCVPLCITVLRKIWGRDNG